MKNVVTATLLGLSLMGTGCTSSNEAPLHTAPAYGSDKIVDMAKPASASVNFKESMILGPKDSWVGRLVYQCSEDPAYMWDFLQAEMPKLGWTQLSGVRSKTSVLVFKRSNRVTTVQIKDRFLYGSQVTCDVAPESNSGSGASDFSGFAPSLPSSSPSPLTHSAPDSMAIQPLD